MTSGCNTTAFFSWLTHRFTATTFLYGDGSDRRPLKCQNVIVSEHYLELGRDKIVAFLSSHL